MFSRKFYRHSLVLAYDIKDPNGQSASILLCKKKGAASLVLTYDIRTQWPKCISIGVQEEWSSSFYHVKEIDNYCVFILCESY